MDAISLKFGDKVTYCPAHGKKEPGIVKSVDGDHAFVVYKYNNDEENFYLYTGCRTAISDLVIGWMTEGCI